MQRNNRQQFIQGKKVELEFKKQFQGLSSTASEDMFDHYDIKIGLNVDVKGMKKTSRSDSKPNENIHWIEIQNVNGKPGWLYGKADFFAFETEDYWIIVSKNALQEFTRNKIKQEKALRPELYKIYQRPGRKDLITMIKTIDLTFISDMIVEKITN